MRLQVRSLVLLSRLRIRHCRELWCTLQTRLGSHVAVAGSGIDLAATALIRPLNWEPPCAVGAGLEKAKNKTNKQTNKEDKETQELNAIPDSRLDSLLEGKRCKDIIRSSDKNGIWTVD